MTESIDFSIQPGEIRWSVPGWPSILAVKPNGDILVKGKLIANDIEVYEALKYMAGRYKAN